MSLESIFQTYWKAKLDFVRFIAEAANKPSNLSFLENHNILGELQPLINDPSENIQQYATLAMARVIQQTPSLAWKAINMDILPILLRDIQNKNKYRKNSIFFLLRAICKHEAKMAQAVLNYGAMDAIVIGLENTDVTVRESAAWVAGYIAGHNETLAQTCVDSALVPLLVLCLRETPLNLKKIASGALCDIAKHSQDLAQCVVDAGAIPEFARTLPHPDIKLKRVVLTALSACAKHSIDLAEFVVEAEIFPATFLCMAHQSPQIRYNACILLRDVVKHTLELTQLMVNIGAVGALMEVLQQNTDECKIPAITALGYIAGHSDQLAITVLGCEAILTLSHILNEHQDDAILAVTVWTLGQIGKHSPEHAKAVAAADLFPRLLQLHLSDTVSEDLRFKCKTTLKMCLQKCLLLSALEPLLYDAPPGILKYVLGQYSKVLPHDPEARRLFVTTGCLKRMQYIEAQPGTTLMEYITIINLCFPEEIVRFYSPGYPETLLDKVEQYSPQMMTILKEPHISDSDIQMNIKEMFD